MPFNEDDKQRLLAVKGVGPTVVTRLEQLGFATLPALAQADVTEIVSSAAALLGSSCWKNSPQARAAISGAIEAARQAQAAPPAATLPVTRPATGRAAPANAAAAGALAALPNLGPKSAAWLVAAGIDSLARLQQLGAAAAYVQVKRSGVGANLNLLWALEGALSGQPWQAVAREHRTSLLAAVETLESGSARPLPSAKSPARRQ